MIRSILSFRGPILMIIYPFDLDNNKYDKPVKKLIKPLVEDECGWDRVKKIFDFNGDYIFTKELQSIINVTVAGALSGLFIGGMLETKNTVNNFIANNEATRFTSHFEAKSKLHGQVFINFMKKGSILGRKIGSFCLLFSSLTTFATAYRGKLAIGNYVFGGFVTGLLTRINMGLRGSLAGAAVGSTLGGVCGGITVIMLYLSGTTIDEILQTQHNWIISREEKVNEKIKTYMAEREDLTEKKVFEQNQKLRLAEQKYKEMREEVKDPSI